MFFTPEQLKAANPPPLANVDALQGAYLFGCGVVGKMLYRILRDKEIRVGGFVDNNRMQHGNLFDREVVSLPEFLNRGNRPVLILAASRHLRELLEQCRNVENVLPYYSCLKLLGVMPYEKQMTAAEIEGSTAAREAYALWDDEASRDKYRKLIRFHATQSPDDFAPHEEEAYFTTKYMPAKYLESVVDCGAYTGDTWQCLARTSSNGYRAYYGFEPDPENYLALARNIGAGDPRIHLYELAVGDQKGIFGMQCVGDQVSKIRASGNTAVHMNTIDSVLKNTAVSCIKMDVEGFEPQALIGAEQTIRRCRPALAVSIYHSIEHYWHIPLWIRGLNLGYKFRLGCHGHSNTDAVCYAVPEAETATTGDQVERFAGE